MAVFDQATHRRWCFTWNNYTPAEADVVKSWKELSNVMYVGREIGPSGTPHLQGYIVFKLPKRFTAVRSLSRKAHWEVAKGTDTDNEQYCEKDGDILIHFDGRTPGKRTDLDEVVSMIAKGATVREVSQVHSNVFIKFHGGISRLIQLRDFIEPPERTHCELLIFHGNPGTGKTYAAQSYKPFPLAINGPRLWWDYYTGQDTVLLEEFKGQVPLAELLTIIDRVPKILEIKGGSTVARWTRVIITTNIPVLCWYAGTHSTDIAPLLDRAHAYEQQSIVYSKRFGTITNGTKLGDFLTKELAPTLPL